VARYKKENGNKDGSGAHNLSPKNQNNRSEQVAAIPIKRTFTWANPERNCSQPSDTSCEPRAQREQYIEGPVDRVGKANKPKTINGEILMELILIIVLVLFLFGGGGYWGRRRGHW
jgi:hypothetical protein